MMLEDHEKRSLDYFGAEYTEVHKWLDEFAGMPHCGMKHRKFRHHLAGIEEVRKMWGDEAAAVAKLHITDDFKWLEGWKDGDPFPKDEKHYVEMGLF
jgi:hypothetical protein